MIQTIYDPTYGELKVVANLIKLSKTPVSYRRSPPELGEHNEEILKELGLSEEKINLLRENGIIQDERPKTYKI